MILGGTTAVAHAGGKGGCDEKFRVPRVKLAEVPTVTVLRDRIQAFRDLHLRFGPIFSYGSRAQTVHVTGVELIDGLRAEPDALKRTKDRADLPAPPGVSPRPGLDASSRVALGSVLGAESLRERYGDAIAGATARACERLTPSARPVEPASLADALAAAAIHRLMFDLDLDLNLQAELHRVAANEGEGPGPKQFQAFFEAHLTKILTRISSSSLANDLYAVADARPTGWWRDQVVGLYFSAWDQARDVIAAALVQIARQPGARQRFDATSPTYPRERFLRDLLATSEVTERRVSRTIRVKGFLIREDSLVAIDPGPTGRDHLVDNLVTVVSDVVLSDVLREYEVNLSPSVDDHHEPKLSFTKKTR